MYKYIMYHYPELQEYRALVLLLAAQVKSQQTHIIPVTHRYHVFSRGAI
jgi:hypothetical protein